LFPYYFLPNYVASGFSLCKHPQDILKLIVYLQKHLK